MKIIKISKNKSKAVTLDLEVKGTHTYQLANGIVSHNSVSLFVKTAPGIHPDHAKPFYIRRIQCNKIDPIYNILKNANPHACEESVWSAGNTDDVVSFPVYTPDAVMVKEDLTAIEHLEIIKSTQINWVLTGTTRHNKKDVRHNVSCTVLVAPDEWGEVTKYIYDNKEFFTAVSLLATSGDKDYKQAPNEAMTTTEDLEKFLNLVENWVPASYDNLIEETNIVNHTADVACSGGACEIKSL